MKGEKIKRTMHSACFSKTYIRQRPSIMQMNLRSFEKYRTRFLSFCSAQELIVAA